MHEVSSEIKQVLDQELQLHRHLLTLARVKHCLLRQGRWAEAIGLERLEARSLIHLRNREALRSRLLEGRADQPELTGHLSSARRTVAVLIRQLGAVERANRMLWNRRLVGLRASRTSAAIWRSADFRGVLHTPPPDA